MSTISSAYVLRCASKDKAGERIQNFERIKFIADEKIKSGGCLIETEYGTVDATVEERVDRPLSDLLNVEPTPACSAAVWREYLLWALLLHGDGMAHEEDSR
jgi:hypothetical protein